MSTHHFDILHAWARLSDEEVLDRFDNQAAMVLKEIASDLDAASARQDVTNETLSAWSDACGLCTKSARGSSPELY